MKVADVITWSTHQAALKAYLGIADTSEDVHLEAWLGLAVQAADHYIDTDLEEVPAACVTGVFEWVKHKRALAGRELGVMSIKTGDLQENYSAVDRTAEDITQAVSDYWWPLKKDVIP